MDSGSLLDLLGNENRRRILRLLANKPCYVTEIGEYLGISPKAVIDHLRRLEEAGLVESSVDERRRKYFRIARNVRLEVNVSPYGFGTKSAYPASSDLDLGRCSHLSVDVRSRDTPREDVIDIADEIADLRELERELSLAQRWVQGRIADRQDRLGEAVDGDEEVERVFTELLVELAGNRRDVGEVAESLEVPSEVVRGALSSLADQDLVEKTPDGWQLRQPG
ncbi:MAG: ArsR/SmtB family transcription factor [Halobacteriaceae archaeon]